MRSLTHPTRRTLATLVIVTASITATGSLRAQPVLTGLYSDSQAGSELTPRVHQSSKLCGKKWLKQARQLTKEQLRWMLQESHSIYAFGVSGRTALTIEVLSTPSFRDCDVRRHWDKRETTVRVTYFLPDGTRPAQLISFAQDDIFFTRRPRVFASLGKALLSGVTVDGSGAGRWVSLPRLSEALRGRSTQPETDSGTVIMAVGPSG